MNRRLGVILLLAFSAICCHVQATPVDISRSQLQAVIGLPLSQAVTQRETFKQPLRSAYQRQISRIDKDCQAEGPQGQQAYNICMGHAEQQADNDFALFYNNLQMLCHDQDQLTTLQASERAWRLYRESVAKATHSAWAEGSGAPGFATQVQLSLVRDRMRELHEMYGLNIAQ
jgi:uncharacterized protein YecT (DUF1311 family)